MHLLIVILRFALSLLNILVLTIRSNYMARLRPLVGRLYLIVVFIVVIVATLFIGIIRSCTRRLLPLSNSCHLLLLPGPSLSQLALANILTTWCSCLLATAGHADQSDRIVALRGHQPVHAGAVAGKAHSKGSKGVASSAGSWLEPSSPQ